MLLINTKLQLKQETAALEQQQNRMKSGNQQSNKGGKSINDESKGESQKNPCTRHDGAHEWKDCPDNKKQKPQSKSSKEKSQMKDLHVTKATNVTTKKTPLVKINKEPEEAQKNHYADLDYLSDDSLAMMVQASNSKQVNEINVIEVPGKEGTCHVTTVLIGNGFTGYAIMSYPFTEKLGCKFQQSKGKGESYRTTTGNMNTLLSVTVTNVWLPHLSRQRTFTATFEVAPPESGDFGYGIMGIGMMDELGINQSRTDKIITWGQEVQVPMVPIGYWTDTCIQMICKHANTEKEHTDSASKNLEIKKENSEGKQNVKFATEANSDLFSATSKPAEASFKKALYKKPNFLEATKCDGKHLTPAQQALLFNILTANEVVFKGGRGHYNGVPVGLKLKDDTKPFYTKPYPIPLKNREVMEHKLGQKCSIRALRRLTPKEFKQREWAFPAFGMPKKNGTV